MLQNATKEAKETPLPAAPAAPAATAEVKEERQEENQPGGGQKEKEEAMAKARAPTGPRAQNFSREGERTVVDPVTGQEVVVKDAELKGQSAPPDVTQCIAPS